MKKFVLFLFAFVVGLCGVVYSQTGPQKMNRNLKVPMPVAGVDNPVIGAQTPNTLVSTKTLLEDPVTMTTRYDFQTNGAVLPHIFRYPDGTIGTVATMSHSDDFTDRGTGYNYFNGTTWNTEPATRIESVRTGWPSYAPLGANGEIVVSHRSATGPLVICRRDTKGTGAWTETELPPPPDATGTGMFWPKMVTNGPSRNNIHIISMTGPVANGGAIYQGLDGALLYNRSLDGGNSWDGWQMLPNMTSAEYIAFRADGYAWAEPKGDTIAFTYGGSWYDQAIMKSTDNGVTWQQTIIWPCPYNKWAGGDTTGTFWCVDNTMAAAIDNNGKVHVTMGLQRASGDEGGSKYWIPFTDGLLYWNEDMPTWPEVLDTAALIAGGNYIGWVQDPLVWNAPDAEMAWYYVSMSSYPTMLIDDYNNIFVVWSGVTNLRDPNNFMLRHLFARAWAANENAWMANIMDITGDFLYNWSECVFPSQTLKSFDDNIYTQFQSDIEAGSYLNGSQGAQGQSTITDNDIVVLTTPKAAIIDAGVGIEDPGKTAFSVSQNMPNPFHGNTIVNINLEKAANLSLTVYSVIGQKVLGISKGAVNSGAYQFVVDGTQLQPGVYFYTVKVNKESVTKKMIVK